MAQFDGESVDRPRPTYRVRTWDCDAQDFTSDGPEFAGPTLWGLRGALRELYDRGRDHVSMLVEGGGPMDGESQDRARPFGNGSEFLDYLAGNCDYCSKSYNYNDHKYVCESERALHDAYLGGGTIPAAVAKRLGVRAGWKCVDYVPIGGDGAAAAPSAADLPGQGMLF